jgi:transcription elongation factor GreA
MSLSVAERAARRVFSTWYPAAKDRSERSTMSESPTYLTPEGLAKLQAELERLIKDRRPEIAAQIHAAKAEGDISDSSGYEEAKNMQAFVEGRIMMVQKMLRSAVLIDGPQGTDTVGLGNRVVVKEGDYDPEEYLIVGPAEADPISGRVSNESPWGKALMGASVGDEVVVKAPSGELRVVLLDIG